MRIPMEIAFRNVEPSAAMEALIRERGERLQRFYRGIIACRVAVEAPHRSGNEEVVGYRVRVEVSVAGQDLVVSRDRSHRRDEFDPYVAIREAFVAMERQLKSHRGRRIRARRPEQAGAPHARVAQIFYGEGYGFLETPGGEAIYFHQNSVLNGGFEDLEAGEEVRFEVTDGDEGPQATMVDPVGRHGRHVLPG